jgi:hypothetical protein
MTKSRRLASRANAQPIDDTDALGLLVAIVDELGEIALTIAAAIEGRGASTPVVTAADELRRAATSLRQEADRLLDRLRAA